MTAFIVACILLIALQFVYETTPKYRPVYDLKNIDEIRYITALLMHNNENFGTMDGKSKFGKEMTPEQISAFTNMLITSRKPYRYLIPHHKVRNDKFVNKIFVDPPKQVTPFCTERFPKTS